RIALLRDRKAGLTSTGGRKALAASRIADYGVIGDCRAAALVSRSGSVDWLCWPRFESPSLFAGLLDPVRGGHWSIRPLGRYRSSHRYLRDTNVLTTRFD